MVAKCPKNKVTAAPNAGEGKEAETAEKAGNALEVMFIMHLGLLLTIILTGIQAQGPLLIQ